MRTTRLWAERTAYAEAPGGNVPPVAFRAGQQISVAEECEHEGEGSEAVSELGRGLDT